MENKLKDYSHIKGWGVDADPENDPAYPMRQRAEETQYGYNWERPVQQPINIEVLHSNERPNVTAVFGTSTPPKGLSGKIRRYAFKYSEGSFGHWIPLILADRVDVVEGVINDLKHGHIPNFFAEKGGKALWKYNRKAIVARLSAATILIAGAIGLAFGKNALQKRLQS